MYEKEMQKIRELYEAGAYKPEFYSSRIGSADLLYGIFMYLVSFLVRGRFNFVFYLKRIILPELVYTVIVSIVIYRVILFICKKLDKKGSEDFIA